jgi:hypothetical protein
MGDREMWKMLHLLYNASGPGLTRAQLDRAGINCYNDTIAHLTGCGGVIEQSGVFDLSGSTRFLLDHFLVANPSWKSRDMLVDEPSAFVIMPFAEPAWMADVESQMIQPAVHAAGFAYQRGDTIVRTGDLTDNVWSAMLHAGVIVADISAVNANVFYELGIARTLGKEMFVLKERSASIPADLAAWASAIRASETKAVRSGA